MESQYNSVAKFGYRRFSILRTCVAAVVLLACGTAAWAHHSFAMFDLENPVEVSGTVKKFRFINPHSWIIMTVEDWNGETVDYTIETNGAFYLARRQGWKRNSLKPGDKVVARVHPLRDGKPGGDLIKLTLSDGSELVARVPNFFSTPQGEEPAEEEK